MSGQAFQFTPGGVEPLVSPTTFAGQVIPAAEAVAQLRAQVAAQPVHTPAKQPLATKPIRRVSLVKEIRERLRAIEREIKSLERLQREAAELRRMLAAAKQPPATVADIHKSRKSG